MKILVTNRLGRVSQCVLFVISLTFCVSASAARNLEFSGIVWTARHTYGPPGNQCFDDSEESVWVDADGKLHLKLRKTPQGWCQAEVVSEQTVGFGTYRFKIRTPDGGIPESVVVGLFLYGNNKREIDVELTYAFDPGWKLLRHTVQPISGQPCQVGGSWCKHWMDTKFDSASTHEIHWMPHKVDFSSWFGHYCDTSRCGRGFAEWSVEEPLSQIQIPQKDDGMRLHINTWLCVEAWCDKRTAPTEDFEIIVDAIEITPLSHGQ